MKQLELCTLPGQCNWYTHFEKLAASTKANHIYYILGALIPPLKNVSSRNAGISSPQSILKNVNSTVCTIQNLEIIQILILIYKVNKLWNSHTIEYNVVMRMYLLIRMSRASVEARVSIFLINSPGHFYAEVSLENAALEAILEQLFLNFNR